MYFTTCKSCHETLEVSWTGQETHPSCAQTAGEIAARQFVDAIQRGDEPEMRRLEAIVNKPEPLPSLGSAALWYASMGWPVLPLQDGQKLPATKHGLNDASTDPEKIAAWWSAHPGSNIGIRTGVLFDVVDIDGADGMQSLAELGDGVLPEVHGKALTPRGIHYFVTATGSGNRAGVRKGIDYRGVGGFVVVAPSVVEGKRYSWSMRPSPAILGNTNGQ